MRAIILHVLLGMVGLLMTGTVATQAYTDSTFFPNPCESCLNAARQWDAILVENKLVSIGGCSFKVHYKKRLCATDGCQELKVLKIEPFSPVPCTIVDPGDIATLAIGAMIEGNVMDFEPDEFQEGLNGCWRFIRPSCWTVKEPHESCLTWPSGEPPIDALPSPYAVTYNTFDLVACDTQRCCTNTMYPTIDNCGTLLYATPQSWDYAGTIGLRGLPPSDPEDLAAFEKAKEDFNNQFSDKSCIPCSMTPPVDCHFDCPEDLMKRYKMLMNKRIREVYGE